MFLRAVSGWRLTGTIVALLSLALTTESRAVGIDDYHLVRSFSLPAPTASSGGNVLLDPLTDGRLLLLNGATVFVETAPQSGVFHSLGNIPGFLPAFGPSFLAVSPNGAHAAAGSNGGGSIVVFSTSDPTTVFSYLMPDFGGEWIDNQRLAVTNFSPGANVQVLDTVTSAVKTVVTNIGGASAGMTFDAAGNLYTGNGFDSGVGGSDTGWVKAFSAAAWQGALATNTPLDFEASGTPIADLLGSYPLGFDNSGNFLVGGADFFGSSGDYGYAALLSAAGVANALANPQGTPPINSASAASVLRKFASPQATIDAFQAPGWNFNNATGELYLGYYGNGTVQVYGVPEPGAIVLLSLGGLAMLMWRGRNSKRRALVAVVPMLAGAAAAQAHAQSPYATELVSQNATYGGAALYNDPNAVLGEPTSLAVNGDPSVGSGPFHVKIVEGVYNREYPSNANAITTLSRKSDGAGGFTYGSITVKFDHQVRDDPTNPYGIDLNVFGNAFYASSGFAGDTADLRTLNLLGSMFAEPVVVSVSPDNVSWYTYSSGPYGDTAFPTQGYEWDASQYDATGNGWTTQKMDFTKPVNPTLASVLGAAGQGLSAQSAIGAYVGSGGGTGIDLAPSGFAWIQYVRVESTAQFRDGEIDAFADVRPMRVGDTLSITPANVSAGTPLYFQNPTNESRTAVRTDFSAISSLAKLATSAVNDAAALAALSGSNLLASYQFDVLPLIGTDAITFAVDYELLPGLSYAGNGSDIAVKSWNGSAWQTVPFVFDTATGLARLEDWTAVSSTLAIIQTASSLPGDFNLDGRVDAADYVVWRNGLGTTYMQTHYELWRANFGRTSGSGAANHLSIVPEPAAVLLGLVGIAGGLLMRHRAA